MNWFDNMIIPMRKAWSKVSKSMGFRRTGLVKLEKDIGTCEYEDVRILWDMLKRQDPHLTRGNDRKGHFWNFTRWANCGHMRYRSSY